VSIRDRFFEVMVPRDVVAVEDDEAKVESEARRWNGTFSDSPEKLLVSIDARLVQAQFASSAFDEPMVSRLDSSIAVLTVLFDILS
jgi:hypothetical protein